MREDAQHELERAVQVRGAFARLVKENFANYPQHVFAALARRDEFFHTLGKEQEADLVVIADG